MTKEDKELLFKDLCTRLPYGVICEFKRSTLNVLYNNIYDDTLTINNIEYVLKNDSIVRPYLRPLPSMTMEERNEVSVLLNYEFYIDDDYALVAEDDRHRVRLDLVQTYTDYLNKKMFAYRTIDDKNMFELGLALEAKPGMYNSQ